MERAITSAVGIWQRFTMTRYLAASIVALGCDVSVFTSLIAFGYDPTIASAIGYCVGIVVHWVISTHFVFVGKKRSGASLLLQRILFAGSAVAGLVITVVTVELLGRAGAAPVPAKMVAIAISFFAVYMIRKWGVFR